MRSRLPRGGRARHHRPSARRRAAHHVGDVREIVGAAASRSTARSSSTSRAIRGPTCSRGARGPAGSVHARAGPPGRDHEPGRLAADTPPAGDCRTIVRDLQRDGIRVSLFVDPDPAAVRWAAALGADRIELYTEPFARAFAAGRRASARRASRVTPRPRRSRTASASGVNAGHDLDLDNLSLFRTLPHLDEVSIGHALDQPRALRRARPGGAGLPGGAGSADAPVHRDNYGDSRASA